jgi:hypothetical protein
MTSLVAAYTAEHGGGTFESATLLPFEPKDGYAVGLVSGTPVILSASGPVECLDKYVRHIAGEYAAPFVGTWLNGDRIHIDPVEYVNDRERAIGLGRVRGQAAIYDFAAGESIDL